MNMQLKPKKYFPCGAHYDTIAFDAVSNIWENTPPPQTFPWLRPRNVVIFRNPIGRCNQIYYSQPSNSWKFAHINTDSNHNIRHYGLVTGDPGFLIVGSNSLDDLTSCLLFELALISGRRTTDLCFAGTVLQINRLKVYPKGRQK